jgi:hypothetical protein
MAPHILDAITANLGLVNSAADARQMSSISPCSVSVAGILNINPGVRAKLTNHLVNKTSVRYTVAFLLDDCVITKFECSFFIFLLPPGTG